MRPCRLMIAMHSSVFRCARRRYVAAFIFLYLLILRAKMHAALRRYCHAARYAAIAADVDIADIYAFDYFAIDDICYFAYALRHDAHDAYAACCCRYVTPQPRFYALRRRACAPLCARAMRRALLAATFIRMRRRRVAHIRSRLFDSLLAF